MHLKECVYERKNGQGEFDIYLFKTHPEALPAGLAPSFEEEFVLLSADQDGSAEAETAKGASYIPLHHVQG